MSAEYPSRESMPAAGYPEVRNHARRTSAAEFFARLLRQRAATTPSERRPLTTTEALRRIPVGIPVEGGNAPEVPARRWLEQAPGLAVKVDELYATSRTELEAARDEQRRAQARIDAQNAALVAERAAGIYPAMQDPYEGAPQAHEHYPQNRAA